MEQPADRLTLDHLFETYQRWVELDKLEQLFCVSQFYHECLPSEGYRTSVDWTTAVALTASGKALVNATSKSEQITEADATLGVLLQMFHRDLLVRVERTDLDQVLVLLSRDVREKNIIYPWIHSRIIFDRFFDLFSSEKEELEPHEVLQLLNDMEQGVFQIGRLTIGPFGVLHSLESRFLNPRRVLSLRLCSDPTCDRLHPCHLISFHSGPGRALTQIRKLIEGQRRDWAVWQRFMWRVLLPENSRLDHTRHTELGNLLATAFTRDELVLVLQDLISTNPNLYRRSMGPYTDGTERVTANGGEYACNLSHAHLLQQILRSSDDDLVAAVDVLIERRLVVIPPTEIRQSRHRGAPTAFDVRGECSHLGLRFFPTMPSFGAQRLLKLILDVHDKQDSWNILNFTLRRFEGQTPENKLVNYLSCTEPHEVLSNAIFITDQHLDLACRNLGLGGYCPPTDEDSEKHLRDRMLWKMGFKLPVQPSLLSNIRAQISTLLVETQTQDTYSFAQEERVRSAAINAFVSLEGVLTDALSFSAWLLLKDHFLDTKFNFQASVAKEFMYSLLNGYNVGDGRPLVFSLNGRNSLFPLIEGFAALAELCQRVVMDSLAHQRKTNEIPLRQRWTQILPFALKHNKLILDIRPEHQSTVIETLRDVSRTLNRANAAGVRNRLSHSGRDFPQRREMEEVVYAIVAIVDLLEATGLYPVIYDSKSRTVDSFGRGTTVYENYREAQVEVIVPSYISECRMPVSSPSMIIVSCVPLGPALEPVRFRLLEHSPYRDLWANLPPRRPNQQSEGVLTDTTDYLGTEPIRQESGTPEEETGW